MNERERLSETFMLQFQELRNETNDSPKRLISFFKDRPSFRKKAENVKRTADLIECLGHLKKLHVQVPDNFIVQWKTYLYKWKKQVEYIAAEPLLSINFFHEDYFKPPTFDEFSKRSMESTRTAPDPEYEEDFDPTIHDGGEAIRKMLILAEHELDSHRSNEYENNYVLANTWSIGIEAVRYVESTIGINLGKAFDRWNLIPPIFIPKRVSDRHGTAKRDSLYELLNDAIRAYVAGAPAASVAMCRAALDIVLRDHYLPNETSKDDSLAKVINLAAKRYDFLDRDKLHKLRENANGILHDYAASSKLTGEDEKMLLSFIRDIKFYIEKAPDR